MIAGPSCCWSQKCFVLGLKQKLLKTTPGLAFSGSPRSLKKLSCESGWEKVCRGQMNSLCRSEKKSVKAGEVLQGEGLWLLLKASRLVIEPGQWWQVILGRWGLDTGISSCYTKSPVPEACSLSKDTGHLSRNQCSLRIVGASSIWPLGLMSNLRVGYRSRRALTMTGVYFSNILVGCELKL